MSEAGRSRVQELAAGVRAGERAALARAITLIESRKREHRVLAQDLLQRLLPATGGADRVGLTGPPGVGKSTVIDTLGTWLTARGRRVAVLAVDPSSTRSGGSILGDKTRMARLVQDPAAFVRPSPTAGTLGGVAARTYESLLLCEAAGYDVVIVETVGTGQSETAVADMTDVFVALALPGAGDELQGIKKGVLELADIVAVNKADGDNAKRARAAAAELRAALHLLTPSSPAWSPPVLAISGLTGAGLDELWTQISIHRTRMEASGERQARRAAQQTKRLWALVDEALRGFVHDHAAVRGELPALEAAVRDGRMTPQRAAERVLALAGLDIAL